ncbi:MAG: hypothetical protein K2X55_04090 [Burkholderiaceae bacterium]|nr:hypothetical protein [Burkholderiaceae bacterium]
MHPHPYRDLIERAVKQGDNQMLDMLAQALADAERAKQILRAKGYGVTGMAISATAAQVPGADD